MPYLICAVISGLMAIFVTNICAKRHMKQIDLYLDDVIIQYEDILRQLSDSKNPERSPRKL